MKNQINIDVDPVQLSVLTVMSNYNEEVFEITVVSGNRGWRYVLSPKHAKRFLLLLQKQIGDYESLFGELQTSLPQAIQDQEDQTGKIGFLK